MTAYVWEFFFRETEMLTSLLVRHGQHPRWVQRATPRGLALTHRLALYNELTRQNHTVLIVGPADNQSGVGGVRPLFPFSYR